MSGKSKTNLALVQDRQGCVGGNAAAAQKLSREFVKTLAVVKLALIEVAQNEVAQNEPDSKGSVRSG